MKSGRCRACGSEALVLVHDFGPQPLAGTYPSVANSETPATRYPLDLTQCGSCGLLQVTNLPPIEQVFNDNYRYSSSSVPDLVRHFEDYADYLQARVPAGASIFEFGCNDGVLLSTLAAKGFRCRGVDASNNVAEIARSKGLDVRTGFLTADFVRDEGLEGRFDAVTCSNVFAHIDDIRGAAEAVRLLLKPGGLFFVEVHDGDVLAREAQFDTVYHEHLSYFTEASLRSFAERVGFIFEDCVRTPMHGGGLRFCARHAPAEAAASDRASADMIDGERFAARIARCRDDLRRLSDRFGPLYGYGAAGRAQMFINMTDSQDCFAAVFDDSPFRQNRFIVGTDIPIRAYGGEEGSCCVILAWNYAQRISDRVRSRFGKIVTLLPDYQEW
jgi:SAM-dependent methyltransferase